LEKPADDPDQPAGSKPGSEIPCTCFPGKPRLLPVQVLAGVWRYAAWLDQSNSDVIAAWDSIALAITILFLSLLEVDHFGCKIKVSKENYYLTSVPPGTVE